MAIFNVLWLSRVPSVKKKKRKEKKKKKKKIVRLTDFFILCRHCIIKTLLLLRPLDLAEWLKEYRWSWIRRERGHKDFANHSHSLEVPSPRPDERDLKMFPIATVCSRHSSSLGEEHSNIPDVLFKLWLVGIYLAYWFLSWQLLHSSTSAFLRVNCIWSCYSCDLSSPKYSHCEVYGSFFCWSNSSRPSVGWMRGMISGEGHWWPTKCLCESLDGANYFEADLKKGNYCNLQSV